MGVERRGSGGPGYLWFATYFSYIVLLCDWVRQVGYVGLAGLSVTGIDKLSLFLPWM
jgi:hypothetical protein